MNHIQATNNSVQNVFNQTENHLQVLVDNIYGQGGDNKDVLTMLKLIKNHADLIRDRINCDDTILNWRSSEEYMSFIGGEIKPHYAQCVEKLIELIQLEDNQTALAEYRAKYYGAVRYPRHDFDYEAMLYSLEIAISKIKPTTKVNWWAVWGSKKDATTITG